MNSTSKQTILECAKSLEIYKSLPENKKKAIYPLFSAPVKLALRIIDFIETSQQTTYAEISDNLSIDRNTVNHVVLALVEGGYPIFIEQEKEDKRFRRNPLKILSKLAY